MEIILIIMINIWVLIFVRIKSKSETKDLIINILLVLNVILSLIYASIKLYGVIQKIILSNELGVIK